MPLAPPPPVVFDEDAFLKRMMDDAALACRIAVGFSDDTRRQIAVLKEAISLGDSEKAFTQSHVIKGAASYVSGESLTRIAAKMEEAALAGDAVALAELLPLLEVQFRLLHEALLKFTQDR